jgi:polyisoprenoid-binding protein YceI
MKPARQIPLIASLVFMVFLGQAQTASKLKAFNFTVHGTSSLHEWESKIEKIEWKGAYHLDASKNLNLQLIELKIPVTGIQSEHGKIMDNKTYEAFNSEQNPNIIFKMRSYTQKVVGNDILLAVEGDLTMNGVTNLIMLSVIGKTLPGGDLQFTGTRGLKMTDYKMKPPTAMMGTIKVGDEVTIKFDLTIGKIVL